MKLRALLLATVLTVIAAPLYAQGERAQIGIGVGLDPSAIISTDVVVSFLPVGLGSVYVPVIIQGRYKIEPGIGFFRYKRSWVQGDRFSETKTTLWHLGLGLLYMFAPGRSLRPYVGPRVTYSKWSEKEELDSSESKISSSDWIIGLVTGGEYFFSDHFTLGGELQLNYIALGQASRDGFPDDSGVSERILNINSLIVLHWYF